MFKYLFKEYAPYSLLYPSPVDQTLIIIGGILIAIPFFTIGIMCVILAGRNPKDLRSKVVLTKIFGYFLVSCALSRALGIFALWHNYARFISYINILTGLLAFLAIAIIPAVVREGLKERKLEQVEQSLADTKNQLDKIEQISNSS